MSEELFKTRERGISAQELPTAEAIFDRNYLVSGTAEFKEAVVCSPRHIDLIEYDDLTLAGAVHVDAQGKRLPGHDFNPDSSFHYDERAAFTRWVDTTPSDKRIAVVEGGTESFSSEEEAVRKRAENGQIAYLSKENGVPCISGDLSDADCMVGLRQQGISNEDIALLWSVSSLPTFARSGVKAEYLGPYLYHQAGFAHVEGFAEFNPDQRTGFTSGMLDDKMVADMNALVSERLIPGWNDRVGDELFRSVDESIVVNVDNPSESKALERSLVPLWATNMQGPLSDLARRNNALRDKHLYSLLVGQVRDGKSPFVTFGESHVISIKPALDAFLGEGRRLAIGELQEPQDAKA